jgi:hypothetical protein
MCTVVHISIYLLLVDSCALGGIVLLCQYLAALSLWWHRRVVELLRHCEKICVRQSPAGFIVLARVACPCGLGNSKTTFAFIVKMLCTSLPAGVVVLARVALLVHAGIATLKTTYAFIVDNVMCT